MCQGCWITFPTISSQTDSFQNDLGDEKSQPAVRMKAGRAFTMEKYKENPLNFI